MQACIVSNRTFYVCDFVIFQVKILFVCIYALVTGAAATKPTSLACRHLHFLFAFLPVV